MSDWDDEEYRYPHQCECDWKYHDELGACKNLVHGGIVRMSPELCVPCLFICEKERDDEEEQSSTWSVPTEQQHDEHDDNDEHDSADTDIHAPSLAHKEEKQ